MHPEVPKYCLYARLCKVLVQAQPYLGISQGLHLYRHCRSVRIRGQQSGSWAHGHPGSVPGHPGEQSDANLTTKASSSNARSVGGNVSAASPVDIARRPHKKVVCRCVFNDAHCICKASRVRFRFEDDALEVLLGDSDAKTENKFVGGA